LDNGAQLAIEQLGAEGDVYRVEGDLDEGGTWPGQWRLRFESSDQNLAQDAVNRASMYLFFRTLEAQLRDGETPLRVGRSRTMTVQLTNPSDEPASDDAFVDGSEIDVFLNGDPVELSPISPDGSFTFDIDLPDDASTDDLVVTADLRPVVRVTDDGPVIELQPWSGELGRLTVEPLPNRPILGAFEPFDVSLDQDERTVRTRALVDASGADAGGCVSLVSAEAPAIEGLDQRGSATVRFRGEEISVGETCPIQLSAGETDFVELELSIDGVDLDSGDRFVVGDVVFETEGEIQPVQVGEEPLSYQAVIEPKVSTETDWWKVVEFSLLALALPLLLLLGANWVAAKLRIKRCAHVVLDVALVNGRLMRVTNHGDAPLSFTSDDLQIIGNPEEGATREVTLAGFDFQARMPANPFGDVYATVSKPGSQHVVGDLGVARPGRGRTPVVMNGAWAFASDGTPVRSSSDGDDLDRVAGRLVIVSPPNLVEAIPFLDSRLSDIADTVKRNLFRVAVDPSEDVTGQLSGEVPVAAGMVSGPAGSTAADEPATRLDPFGNPIVTPTSSAPDSQDPSKSERRSKRRNRNDEPPDPTPPSPPDGPSLPF